MIQAVQLAFLALFFAHLLGDFLLQPSWMARSKGQRLWPLLCHGVVHYVVAWISLFLFTSIAFLSAENQAVVVGCIFVHLLIDKLRHWAIADHKVPDGLSLFILDQVAHVLVLAGAACFLARCLPVALFHGMNPAPLTRIHILQAAIIYVAVVFGGGILIRYVTLSFEAQSRPASSSGLKNAGLYIGWIERFLLVTAILVQSPVLVGLILTGKSIARFPEFKEARFAEYFLIGTLLSVSLSVLGGVFLLFLLYGSVSLR